MEKEIPVRVVKIVYQCPACMTGHMISTGAVLTTYPAQYPHICDYCGAPETFVGEQYPKIEYREIE
jgi:hypothetical protein